MDHLRKQTTKKSGKAWSIEELEAGLVTFKNNFGHYPTASEIDHYEFLPSARTIERSHGGIIELRKILGLGTEHDFRTGAHSIRRAYKINQRAHEMEYKVYDFLLNLFGKEFVHREFFFTDDHRTRADFFIYDKDGGFCVDVFYPSTSRNLSGCLNAKLNKYSNVSYSKPYPVIFLQMNSELSQNLLNEITSRKDKKLINNQHLMCWDTFQQFCHTRTRLRVA